MLPRIAKTISTNFTLTRDGRSMTVRGSVSVFVVNAESFALLRGLMRDLRGLVPEGFTLRRFARGLHSAGVSVRIAVSGRQLLVIGKSSGLRLPLPFLRHVALVTPRRTDGDTI